MFYSPTLPESEELAAIMQRHFREMLQPENTREHKRSAGTVPPLQGPNLAVLWSAASSSNPQEATNLIDPEYQEKVAFVIYSSVMEFLYRYKTKDGKIWRSQNQTNYVCSACEVRSPKWYGKCPECGAWNTFEEQVKSRPSAAKCLRRNM